MNISRATTSTPEAVHGLTDFCRELFGSLSRSDQRRWGEVYLHGLLSVPGRKTIRQISTHAALKSAGQCLQQFLNQSPWRWEPVRQALAHQATPIRPRAWVFQDVVFPKDGTSSVGVDRQHAPPAERVVNCQVGMTALLAGEHGASAVNWRLMLPRSWDEDAPRRARTRVPDQERHHPRWRHVLDMVDEMATGWGLRRTPIVLCTSTRDARHVLHGLTARGLPYLVRVPGNTPVLRRRADGWVPTAGGLVSRWVEQQLTVPGHEHSGGWSGIVQYSVTSVCDACLSRAPAPVSTRCTHVRTRRVLAEWVPGGRRPSAVWLTNLTAACLRDLISLAATGTRASEETVPALRNEFGLQDFEGRSFAGWHHHVTLVSAAHTLRTLLRMSEQRADVHNASSVRGISTVMSTSDDRPLTLRQA